MPIFRHWFPGGPVCGKGKISRDFKLICPVQSPWQNIPLVTSGKSTVRLAASCPERGALRNVINAGRDAVDAGGALDETR
jgi:hypothetical protein